MTRPDAMHTASLLCSFTPSAGAAHVQACMDLLGYYVATKEMGITFGGKLKVPMGLDEYPPFFIESRGLHTITDSSWGTEPRPYGGFVVMYCNGAIYYGSKKMKIVPDSTCEAETALASKGAKETVAARLLLEDVRRPVIGPTALIGDNKATRDLLVNPGSTSRTRYFERATMLVKRLVQMLVVTPYLVGTDLMVADILTKSTKRDTFKKMRAYLLNLPAEASVMLEDGQGNRVSLRGKALRLWSKVVQNAGRS